MLYIKSPLSVTVKPDKLVSLSVIDSLGIKIPFWFDRISNIEASFGKSVPIPTFCATLTLEIEIRTITTIASLYLK